MHPQGVVELWQRPEVYINCMSPRNPAACSGNCYSAVPSGEISHFRSLPAKYGLTPKFNRGLAAGEAGDVL